MNNKVIMKLVEVSTLVNNEGEIIINRNMVENMGFSIGDRIWFTYLTPTDGIENIENVFVVTPKRLEDMENVLIEEDKIEFEVPEELLDRAGISNTADIDIICDEKKIILKERIEVPEQVFEVCERIGIERDTVEAILKGE